MLKNLYEHFEVLYEELLPKNPSIAAEHALQQEEEVYKNSTKLTYRQVRHMSLIVGHTHHRTCRLSYSPLQR